MLGVQDEEVDVAKGIHQEPLVEVEQHERGADGNGNGRDLMKVGD